MFDLTKHVFRSPDGGAGAGAGGGEGGAGVTGGQDAAVQTGEAAAAQPQQAAQRSQDAADQKARTKAYREMIRGEYRDLYNADVQRIVQDRLKSAKGAEESMAQLEPALKLLQQTYGTENLEELAKAIQADDRYYEDGAMQRGMDVETYKALRQRDMAIERYEAEKAAERERAEQTAMVMQWRAEEAKLKETFPDFDLETEMDLSGGELFNLLKRGVSLEHAYLALHMDDIVGNTVQGAMQRGAQSALQSIRANGMRPGENGNGDAPGVQRTYDLSKLTKEKMRELERRAARGEEITPDKFGI